MTSVQNDFLGVTAEGSWVDAPAHSRITLTPAGDVRLVSRKRSPVPIGPPPEEGHPRRLLLRPATVTLEERALLSELAVSEAQAERGREEQEVQEASGLSEDESAACVVVPTLVSLSETEDESTTTMETQTELREAPSWFEQCTRSIAVKHSRRTDLGRRPCH